MIPAMLVAFLLSSAQPLPADTTEWPIGTIVVSGDDLVASGAVRLSDVWRLIPGWNALTLDGFHYHADPFLPAMQGGDRWQLLVDGHPVNAEFLDVHDLNILPISLDDVAAVEVSRTPRIAAGRLQTSGLIHIRLKKRRDGAKFGVTYWRGNEAGDSGPFRYLGDPAAVDQLGPGATASVNAAGGGMQTTLAVLTTDHHPTDPAIVERMRVVVPAWPNIWRVGSSARFRFTHGPSTSRPSMHESSIHRPSMNGPSTHGAFALGATGEDYLFSGLLGRELPVRGSLRVVSINGDAAMGVRSRLLYHATTSTTRLNARRNQYGYRLEDEGRQIDVHVGIRHQLSGWIGRTGLRTTWLHLQDDISITDERRQAFGAYAEVRRNAAWRCLPNAAVDVESRRGDLDWRAYVSTQCSIAAGHVLYGSLTYSEASGDKNIDAASWTQRHQMFGDAHLTWDSEPLGKSAAASSMDIIYRRVGNTGLNVELHAWHRWHRRVTLTRHEYLYRADEEVFSGPAFLVPGLDGHVQGGSLSLAHRLHPALRHRTTVTLERPVAGDDLFLDVWLTRPRWEVQSRLHWAPSATFRLFGALQARGRTRWPDYPDATDGSRARYTAKVPAWWTVDVAATKWFWQSRIQGVIAVRNVLNRKNRQHTIGSTTDLSLYLSVSVTI